MKKKEDFIKAIGPADARFEASIHQTLGEMQRKEDEKPMKRISVSFAIVLTIILLAAMAMAAATQWGVFDFIANQQGEGKVLEEAAALLQSDLPQEGGQAEGATFTLREAVYDGKELYMVVAVTPKDAQTMLLGVDATPSDSMVNMGPQFEGVTASIEEYAAQQGKTQLLHTNIYDNVEANGVEGLVSTMDYVMEQDGTLVYILKGSLETEAVSVPVELICMTSPYEDSVDGLIYTMEKTVRTPLNFTLQTAQVRDSVSSTQPALYSDCGVQVDRVTLSSTAMATHVMIEFSVVDAAAYALTDDGLWFEFLDANGERLPDGPMGSGSVYAVDEAGTRFIQEDSLTAMETLPEKVVLRGYNAWEKNRYETHEIELNPAK